MEIQCDCNLCVTLYLDKSVYFGVAISALNICTSNFSLESKREMVFELLIKSPLHFKMLSFMILVS